MKIDNKRNLMYVRIIMFTMCIIIAPALFMVSTFWGIILFSIVLIFFMLGIFLKYTEFDYSGECISVRQFHFLRSGYIRPKIEIPRIYLNDYSIENALGIHYLIISIHDGSSKKMVKIALFVFNPFDIIKIAKTLENIRKENNYQEMRILSEPAFTNMFEHTQYIID